MNAPHRRSDAQDDLEGVPHASMDYGFLGERGSEDRVSPVLVIRERRHKTMLSRQLKHWRERLHKLVMKGESDCARETACGRKSV